MLEGQFTPGCYPQFEQIMPNFLKRRTMLQMVSQLGLLTGLKVCLDASDGGSLPASSAKWLDTAGGGYDFFRGTSSGADASDPTINGSANGRSANEYLSFDGGDYLTYDTTNETWMNNFHKAGAKWAVATWIWYAASGSAGFIGTNGNSISPGFAVGMSSGGKLITIVHNASTQIVNNVSTTSIPTGQWCFLGNSFDSSNGSTGNVMCINGTIETFSGTLSSPSASNASFTMQIGSRANATVPLPNTSRMGAFIAWESVALTQQNLLDLFNTSRARYGV